MKATIKCYSCARFQGGHGSYCGDCFEAYHPWYRATHTWLTLEDSPGSKKELETQTYRADLERDVADTRGMLQGISLWRREIETQHADTKVGETLRV